MTEQAKGVVRGRRHSLLFLMALTLGFAGTRVHGFVITFDVNDVDPFYLPAFNYDGADGVTFNDDKISFGQLGTLRFRNNTGKTIRSFVLSFPEYEPRRFDFPELAFDGAILPTSNDFTRIFAVPNPPMLTWAAFSGGNIADEAFFSVAFRLVTTDLTGTPRGAIALKEPLRFVVNANEFNLLRPPTPARPVSQPSSLVLLLVGVAAFASVCVGARGTGKRRALAPFRPYVQAAGRAAQA